MITVGGFHIPDTLEGMITPFHTAHIIIDAQNDFYHSQRAFCSKFFTSAEVLDIINNNYRM